MTGPAQGTAGNGRRRPTLTQRVVVLMQLAGAAVTFALAIFFALGFQFRTPASWLGELAHADTIEREWRSAEVRRLDARIDTLVALGVARDEKLDFLIRLGCDQVSSAALVRACDGRPRSR